VAPIIRIGDVDVSLEEVMMDPERCHLVVDVSAAMDGGPLTLQTTRLALAPVPPFAKPTPATGTPVPVPSSPPPPAVVRGTGDWPGIKFQQAEQYKAIPAGRKIDLVVLHTAELSEIPTGAEAVANYFSRPRGKNGEVVVASAHACVDDDSIVQCVLEKDIAYAAPGANNNGLHIEHAGFARQTAAEWADAYSTRELTLSAQLTAKLCVKHAIPPNYVDDVGLLAGARGITTHVAVSRAFKRSNHQDPGPSFPMERYLGLVRQFILRQAAEDRIKELAEVPTQEARELSAAFRSIVAILMSWSPTNKPTEDERTRLQEELFAKNKIAATLLERHAIQSGKPPWQPPPRGNRPPKKR
jgi:N-acetyl-anhydromuramyl-L-alanine amidase AmpD